jgi:DNA-binding XRE family transcriptional regulator
LFFIAIDYFSEVYFFSFTKIIKLDINVNLSKSFFWKVASFMDNSEIKQRVGDRIRRIREDKNMSQQEIAVLCDFEKSSMSRIEAGRTNPTVTTLYKISSALGVAIKDLVDIKLD